MSRNSIRITKTYLDIDVKYIEVMFGDWKTDR